MDPVNDGADDAEDEGLSIFDLLDGPGDPDDDLETQVVVSEEGATQQERPELAESDESAGSGLGEDLEWGHASPVDPPQPDTADTQERWQREPLWPYLGRTVLGIMVLGLIIRLAQLGDRPLHHDEGLDAWFSWRFVEGTYEGYDPVYHGPLRFYITGFIYTLFGESAATARLTAALAGALVIGVPWLWRRQLGNAATIATALIVAVSPSMVYFSRVGREDSLWLALTATTILAIVALIRSPRWWHPLVIVGSLVAGWAVKESTLLTIFLVGAIGIALLGQQSVFSGGDGRPALVTASGRIGFARASMALGLLLMILAFHLAGNDHALKFLALYGAAISLPLAAGLAHRTLPTEGAAPALAQAVARWGAIVLGVALALMAALSLTVIVTFFTNGQDAWDWGRELVDLWGERLFKLLAIASILCLLVFVVNVVVALARAARVDIIVGTVAVLGAFGLVGWWALEGGLGVEVILEDFGDGGLDISAFVTVVMVMLIGAALIAALALSDTMLGNVRNIPIVRALAQPGQRHWTVATVLGIFAFGVIFTMAFTTRYGALSAQAPYDALTDGLRAGYDYWMGEQRDSPPRGDARWQYYLAVVSGYEWFGLALAFVGAMRVFKRPTLVHQVIFWWGLGSFIIHSWAKERMPWLIIHPLFPLLILAGIGASVLWDRRRKLWAPPLAAALAFGFVFMTFTTYQAAYVRGEEQRELFVQAGQATYDVPAWTERVRTLQRLKKATWGEDLQVAIDDDVYWPYGFYLRDDSYATFTTYDGTGEAPTADVIMMSHIDLTTLEAQLDGQGYTRLPYTHRWWWVPDYTSGGVSGWLKWVWNREIWEECQPPPGVIGDGALTGAVFVKTTLLELEATYGSTPPAPAQQACATR